jgi:hypothetical protein
LAIKKLNYTGNPPNNMMAEELRDDNNHEIKDHAEKECRDTHVSV